MRTGSRGVGRACAERRLSCRQTFTYPADARRSFPPALPGTEPRSVHRTDLVTIDPLNPLPCSHVRPAENTRKECRLCRRAVTGCEISSLTPGRVDESKGMTIAAIALLQRHCSPHLAGLLRGCSSPSRVCPGRTYYLYPLSQS